jgi:hypothetical protein
MNRSHGVTELCWSSLTEDQRLLWKYFSRGLAIAGAFFVSKTGSYIFDWFLLAITTVFMMLVIETQRTYTRLSPSLRKRSVRVAIGLGSWSIVALGAAIFVQAGFIAVASVLVADVLPLLQSNTNPIASLIIVCTFGCAAIAALFITFRQLRIEELIYHLPRHGLKELLIRKRFRATSFPMFAVIELWALFICMAYASSIANIAKIVMI